VSFSRLDATRFMAAVEKQAQGVEAGTKVENGWQCQICTFRNKSGAKKCQVCQGIKKEKNKINH